MTVKTDRVRQQLADALQMMIEHYVRLVNSGDAGHWNAELEPQVREARATLAAHDAAQSAGREQEAVLLPRNVVGFLLGANDLEGLWFGEEAVGRKPFWWRSYLTGSAPPSAPASVPVSDAVRALVAKWIKDADDYPNSLVGSAYSDGIRICAYELEAALAGSAGEPGESP